MGHQTIQHVPRMVHTYEKAAFWYKACTPIRGREPEKRPLGQRRDVDTYWVRKANVISADGEKECIDFMLYQTPVIRYYPDDTIEIRTAGWSTVSTHQMFQHVLGIEANGYRGATALDVQGEKAIMKSNDVVRMKVQDGKLQLLDREQLYGYKANRKNLNAVRKQYSQFADYLKGFMSLRGTTIDLSAVYGRPATHYQAVTWTYQEMADMFGKSDNRSGEWTGKVRQVVRTNDLVACLNLPWERGHGGVSGKTRYVAVTSEFLGLVRNDQPEETRTDNYYRAALALILMGKPYLVLDDEKPQVLTDVRTTSIGDVNNRWETIVKKWHRAEYLDKVALEPGQLPNMMYTNWMEHGND